MQQHRESKSVRFLRLHTLAPIALVIFGSACTVVDGNGVIVTEERPLSGFNDLQVEGDIRVDVQIDPTVELATLAIEGDENLLPHISTQVRGRHLVIAEASGIWLSPTRPLTVTMRVPQVRGIEAGSSASVLLRSVDQPTLRVRADDSSRVVVSGTVEDMSAVLSGSAHLDALDLNTWVARIEARDSANAQVCVEETLEAQALGSASVAYACNPFHIYEDAAGTGSVYRY